MFYGLGIGRAAERAFSSLEPIVGRLLEHAGFGEMVRKDFRVVHDGILESVLKGARYLSMKLPSPSLQQALVSRIPDQCMLEAVHCIRQLTLAENKSGLLKLGEGMLQPCALSSYHSQHQGIGKFATD